MKHSFLYVLGFFHLGLHPGRLALPAPRALLTPREQAACQALLARQNYGAVAGASPVAGPATSTGEALDTGARTIKGAQGKPNSHSRESWSGLG